MPLRIRYGALLALTTAVEWSVKRLCQNLIEPVEDPGKEKSAVNRLKILTNRAGLERGELISNFEALTYVRNCIAHNAGLEEGDKFETDLPKTISRLGKGFSLAGWHFLGSHVAIDKGALEKYIEEMQPLMVDLSKKAYEQGLLKSDT